MKNLIFDYKDAQLIGCDFTYVSHDGQTLWECTQTLCDGEHHWMETSPWKYREWPH
jgi:hypothetical protein